MPTPRTLVRFPLVSALATLALALSACADDGPASGADAARDLVADVVSDADVVGDADAADLLGDATEDPAADPAADPDADAALADADAGGVPFERRNVFCRFEPPPERTCEGTPVDLVEALAGASAGDVIVAAAGSYDGPLTVPAGVSVCAPETGTVTIAMSAPSAALTLETAPGQSTSVAGLVVDADGAGVAILVAGTGSASLEDVRVTTTTGYGLVAEDLAELRLEAVCVDAAIERLADVRYPIDPSAFPVMGVALRGIAELDANRTDVRGFAGFGAVLVDVAGRWTSSVLARNVGVGLLQSGGALTTRGVRVQNTVNCPHASCALNNQVYAVALLERAELTSEALAVVDNEGIGLFQDDACSVNDELVVTGNRNAGVWLQNVQPTASLPGFEARGVGSRIERNGGAGVMLLDSGGVTISGARIAATSSVTLASDDAFATIRVADGLHANGLAGPLRVVDTEVSVDNAAGDGRVGVLLDGSETGGSEVTLTNLSIAGTQGNGLVAQGGVTAQASWQTEVASDLARADSALSEDLDTAAALLGVPSARALGGGLRGELGIIDDNGIVNPDAIIDDNGVVSPGGE